MKKLLECPLFIASLDGLDSLQFMKFYIVWSPEKISHDHDVLDNVMIFLLTFTNNALYISWSSMISYNEFDITHAIDRWSSIDKCKLYNLLSSVQIKILFNN